MTRYRLFLTRPLYEEMLEHAVRELPNECCGILAGTLEDREAVRVGVVRGVLPLVNELASPRAYRSEALSMFRAQRAIRAAGWQELAIYHSHPASDAVPSKYDLADNYSPDVIQLIISLKDGRPQALAWWLTAHAYRPAELDIDAL
jgi:proteasome lid subunit RPN8/RPN11